MIEETEERKAEKAQALKDMRKHGLLFIIGASIVYLLSHFYYKIF